VSTSRVLGKARGLIESGWDEASLPNFTGGARRAWSVVDAIGASATEPGQISAGFRLLEHVALPGHAY
jgi:hypothetical protein